MKTYMAKQAEVKRSWHVVDAKDMVLGRLSTRVAGLLKGKGKVTITPHVDSGDGVVVINAEKIKVTGTKLDNKMYKRYSGYPGGLKEEPMKHLMARRPAEVIRHAVKGMLPKNKLGDCMLYRLKVYAGDSHPHNAQLVKKDSKKASK